MMIFLAYEGFELIANTAENIKNPKRNLPLAYYSSVGFVIVLYFLVSLVTVGNLAINKIIDSKDYALAEAAKPFLGSAGFILITVAALLSTSSAINATLYGAAKISYTIAKDGELPVELEKKIWNRPLEGLLITCGITLLVANLFDLTSISTMGSSGFLLIFTAVNISNAKLFSATGSKKWISIIGAVICFTALIILLIQQTINNPRQLIFFASMIGLSFMIEFVYRKLTRRTIKSSKKS
jgi:amino acid transporter